jgi:hypothetical protein
MECKNKGLWHLSLSEEACKNAGGKWIRTPCFTLQEAIDDRPSRFDLVNPVNGSCQENIGRLETAFVVASTTNENFPFEATHHGCLQFCQSLPNYPEQISMTSTISQTEWDSPEETRLQANYGATDDYFGYSLAIDGKIAIVGTPWHAANGRLKSGAAYVFELENGDWVQTAKLTADDGNAYDYFGYSVAIDGNIAIVGAYGDNDNGKYQIGSAFFLIGM